MTQPDLIGKILITGIGLYLVVGGLTAEYLIDESEGVASDEKREKANATPVKRFIVVSAGIASFGYGIYHLLH
jgi:hypothetical protein